MLANVVGGSFSESVAEILTSGEAGPVNNEDAGQGLFRSACANCGCWLFKYFAQLPDLNYGASQSHDPKQMAELLVQQA